jgi:hypothetical protein
MKRIRLLTTLLLLAGIAALAAPSARADSPLSEIIFYVHWYDVGKAALDGLDGVKKVTRGWRWGREINTVTYDPEVITPEEMVAALKTAGTYAGTVEWGRICERLMVP